MKALLGAAVALSLASPCPALGWHPECNASGIEKTLTACGGEDGSLVGTRACRKRLTGTIKNCHDRIEDHPGEREALVAMQNLPRLNKVLDVQRTDPNRGAETDRQAKAEGEKSTDDPPGGKAWDAEDVGEALEDARQALLARDPGGAADLLEPLLRRHPGNLDALRLHAQASINAGDRETAAADAKRVLQLAPQDELARSILGQAEALARSADKLKRGPTVDFDSKEDGGFAGPDANRRAESESAVTTDFGAPPAAAPASGLQVWQQANRHFSLGDWTSAVFHATRYIKLHPEDPRGWILRARASNKLKNWAAAEADAKKALELRPDDPAALLELGYAELQLGRAEEAQAHIQRALALDPKNGLGHLYLAQTLEALGRRAEAVQAYKTAARLDPALKPVVDAALAKLDTDGNVPRPAAPPPWRVPLRAGTASVAAVFLFLGLRYVLGARRSRTTAPPEPVDLAPATASPTATPAAGDLVGGQFRIERELARGGMGMVYLATDTVLNRPVAIKRLNREAMASADARRKFLQEAQLAARLKHQNLAQILSVFGEGELFLVFELVKGEGLDALLARRGTLTLAEARGLVRQACAALACAHANRVIHRDLKPANMMVAADGTLKLMDFGIAHEARTVSGATATQAWGTPPYMAPEQEDGYVLPASDLYALAVTAYELLSGTRPFDGPGLSGQKRAKRFAPLAGTRGLPRGVDAFFRRALDPDPSRRFATAEEFSAAFDALSETPIRS